MEDKNKEGKCKGCDGTGIIRGNKDRPYRCPLCFGSGDENNPKKEKITFRWY